MKVRVHITLDMIDVDPAVEICGRFIYTCRFKDFGRDFDKCTSSRRISGNGADRRADHRADDDSDAGPDVAPYFGPDL